MDIMTVITFIGAVFILFIILKLLTLPMKLIIKLVINGIFGGLVLYGLSLVGITVTINWITALVVGILGIPGALIVVALSLFHVI